MHATFEASRSGLLQSPKKLPNPISRLPSETGAATVCEPIFEEVCVLANGDVVCSSCDVDGSRVYGNVLRDRLADIFDGALYREMREWQLKSRPDSWCPGIERHCPKRIEPATSSKTITNRKVEILKLEPTTHCNLKCPSCPVVSNFEEIPELNQHRAYKFLPTKVMLDVVDQLPDLRQILYFNFGEPFLNKGTVTFLREVKRKRPEIQILTNTNGLALGRTQSEAIASEALMDHVVFSIDGATQESYAKYRVGGDFEKALGKLRDFVSACERAGTRERITIIWQYILFEWNDSDAELALANKRAKEIGVPIDWVITHDEGASKRFRSVSDVKASLTDDAVNSSLINTAVPAALAFKLAERQITDFASYATIVISSEIYSTVRKRSLYITRAINLLGRLFGRFAVRPADRARATFSADTSAVSILAGYQIEITIKIKNYAALPLITSAQPKGALRLGLRLLDTSRQSIEEITVPLAAAISEKDYLIRFPFRTPKQAGVYELLFDAVEEHVCWFSDRGSKPLKIGLQVS